VTAPLWWTWVACGLAIALGSVGSAWLTRRALRRQRALWEERLLEQRREAHRQVVVQGLEIARRADTSADLEFPGTAALMIFDPGFDWDAAVALWGPCGHGADGGWCSTCPRSRQVARWVRSGLVSPEAVPGAVCCADGQPHGTDCARGSG
jgi:hypothetical protein